MVVEIVSWPISTKEKKYMTVEIVSLWWPISTKVCCRMWGSNTRLSACGHSRACPTEIPCSVRERERETKRESFLLCDSSRSLSSLYASRVGNKEKESNISDLIDCFLNAIHRQSLSLSLSLSLCVHACVCELCKKSLVKAHWIELSVRLN